MKEQENVAVQQTCTPTQVTELENLLRSTGFSGAYVEKPAVYSTDNNRSQQEEIKIIFPEADTEQKKEVIKLFTDNFFKLFSGTMQGKCEYILAQEHDLSFLRITREKPNTPEAPLIDIVITAIKAAEMNAFTFSPPPLETPIASTVKNLVQQADSALFVFFMEMLGLAKEFFEALMKSPAFKHSIFGLVVVIAAVRWVSATYEFFKGTFNKNLSSTVGFIDLTIKTIAIITAIIGTLVAGSLFIVVTPTIFVIATALDVFANFGLMLKDITQLVRLAWHKKDLTATAFGKKAHEAMVDQYVESLKGHAIGTCIALILTTAITVLMLAPHASVPIIATLAAVKVAGVTLGAIVGGLAGAVLALSVVQAIGEFIATRERVKPAVQTVKDWIGKGIEAFTGLFPDKKNEAYEAIPPIPTDAGVISSTVDKFKQLGFDGISVNLDKMAVEYIHEKMTNTAQATNPVQIQVQDQAPNPDQAQNPAKDYLTIRLTKKTTVLEQEIQSDTTILGEWQKEKRESKKVLLDKAKGIMTKKTVSESYTIFKEITPEIKDAKNKKGTFSSAFRNKSETQELLDAVDFHRQQPTRKQAGG